MWVHTHMWLQSACCTHAARTQRPLEALRKSASHATHPPQSLEALRNMAPIEGDPADEFVWALPFATGERTFHFSSCTLGAVRPLASCSCP